MMSRELQIEIDDVYACLGACPGCVLSRNERRAARPDMDPMVMDNTLERIIYYIRHNELGIDTLNLTFGIGDHLILGSAYVNEIYEKAAYTIDKVQLKGDVFVTLSLVGKPKHVKDNLITLKDMVIKHDYNARLIPVVVFDPIKMRTDRFWDGYFENISAARDLFGRVDLTLNLSTPMMKVMDAASLAEFADKNQFHDVTINWTPTDGNIADTANDIPFLNQWLIDFDVLATEKGIEFSYRPVFERLIDSVKSDFALIDLSYDMLKNTIARSLQFDHEGNYFGKMEGVGDMAMGPRFGIEPIGNVFAGEIMDNINLKTEFLARQSIRDLLRQPACVDCPHNTKCITSAAPVYNRVLYASGIKSKTCPSPMKALFEHYS